MLIGEVQMVLDKILSIFSTVSPQILRSAVEYAQVESTAPDLEDDAGVGAVASLGQRIQGYVGGYCDCIDGVVAEISEDIAIDDPTARKYVDVMKSDMGEELSYSAFVGAGIYADLISAGRPSTLSEDQANVTMYNCVHGYLDGFSQAERDREGGKFIRDMGAKSVKEQYDGLVKSTAKKVDVEPDYESKIHESVMDGIEHMFIQYLYPKSGHVADEMTKPESFVTVFFLGFLKGADKAHEVEAEMLPYEDVFRNADPVERIFLRRIVKGAEMSGITRKTGERAAAATYAFSNAAVSGSQIENATMAPIDVAFGMGYLAGLRFLLGKRIEKRGGAGVEELAAEIDAVFADFDDKDLDW